VSGKPTDTRTGRLALFGEPPLIEGEDPAAYDEIVLHVSTTVKPADILEDIWVRDVVDLTWEIWRHRHLKASLLNARAREGLQDLLEALSLNGGEQLQQDWAVRKPKAIARVDRLLASVGLTRDAVMAETLYRYLDQITRIDAMIALAENRRSAVLCEIERHRVALARRLRRTVQDLEDGGHTSIEAKPGEVTPSEERGA
jgi:hypothetical protein